MRRKAPGLNRVAAQSWLRLTLFMLFSGAGLLNGCGSAAPVASPRVAVPTPHLSTPAGPFHSTFQTLDKDLTITLAITPARSGPNMFHMLIINNHHVHTSTPFVKVVVYVTMQDMPMGTDSLVLSAQGGGQFGAVSNLLSMAGDWALGITVETTDHVVHRAGIRFVLPES